jgi:hypothetical protein
VENKIDNRGRIHFRVFWMREAIKNSPRGKKN